jgi:hypothetical protein
MVEKAVDLCPEIAQTDTIRDTLQVYIPEVKIDTVLLKSDTIILNKDHWRVRIINTRDSVYITGGCDSIFVEVPVEVPCDTINPTKEVPREFTWWQIALMVLGGIFIAYITIRITTFAK